MFARSHISSLWSNSCLMRLDGTLSLCWNSCLCIEQDLGWSGPISSKDGRDSVLHRQLDAGGCQASEKPSARGRGQSRCDNRVSGGMPCTHVPCANSDPHFTSTCRRQIDTLVVACRGETHPKRRSRRRQPPQDCASFRYRYVRGNGGTLCHWHFLG